MELEQDSIKNALHPSSRYYCENVVTYYNYFAGFIDQLVRRKLGAFARRELSSERMGTKKANLTPEETSEMKRRAIMARWKDKTKPNAATLELVREACADGATVGNICAVLGISDWTFRNWKDKYPDFAEAVKAGRQIEHDRLVNKLVEMALNGNVSCLIYCLKARHGLLDNQVNNVVENKVAITFQLPDAMRPDDYLKTLTASAELIAPDDAKKALAKPGVRAKVLKELEAENAGEE